MSTLNTPNTNSHLASLQRTFNDLQTGNPYAFFDLWPGCGRRAVEDAFLSLVPKHHPDRFAHLRSDEVSSLANTIFLELNHARARLLSLDPSAAPATPPA